MGRLYFVHRSLGLGASLAQNSFPSGPSRSVPVWALWLRLFAARNIAGSGLALRADCCFGGGHTLRRRGFSFVELMLAMSLSVLIGVAVAQALIAGFDYERHARTSDPAAVAEQNFRTRLTQLLQGARLTTAAGGDQDSYFVASSGPLQSTQSGQSAPGAGGGQNSSNFQLPGSGGADSLVFTTQGDPVPQSSVNSTETDFETLNQDLGPEGGIEEAALTTTSLWDGGGHSGLFLRIQRPADGDPTQGGTESVLEPDIKQIQFQFWDGIEWVSQWSTQQMGTAARLPGAVQVSYWIGNDSQPRMFIVRLPMSDVTETNPVTQFEASATGGPA